MVKTIVFNGETRHFESAPTHRCCLGCVAYYDSEDGVNSGLCGPLGDCVGIIYKEVTEEQEMPTKAVTQAPELINMTDKYRTRWGDKVRILCIDAVGANPVVTIRVDDGSVSTHTATGSYWLEGESSLDLIKVCPYADFKKGDKVIAVARGGEIEKRRFSHATKGIPYCFTVGDEWTSGGAICVWDSVRRPTAEELK